MAEIKLARIIKVFKKLLELLARKKLLRPSRGKSDRGGEGVLFFLFALLYLHEQAEIKHS
jgi:hypothetical protein